MIQFRSRRSRRLGGLSWRERMADIREQVWLCEIRRVHRIKMQSYGHCIRCGRKVQ